MVVLAGHGAFAKAIAQPAGVRRPVIGFLHSGSAKELTRFSDAFRQGLKEGGFVDGKDVTIEYRWAEGHYERLPGLAQELVERDVAVIAAVGGPTPAMAAKSATAKIPVVFASSADPVKFGLVASLSRPGGNVTGVTNISPSLDAKRLQILHDLVPTAARTGFLVNPKTPNAQSRVKDVMAAAASVTSVDVVYASTASEIDEAFAALKQRGSRALLVETDPIFVAQRERIVAHAARYAIATLYPFREFVSVGGLISYGPDLIETNRQCGLYVARILKGAKPAEMPVVQADKFELVINRQTAKKLRLSISRDFLARVDEALE